MRAARSGQEIGIVENVYEIEVRARFLFPRMTVAIA
jgi:hypothetical protein